jgi:hypothetical protein
VLILEEGQEWGLGLDGDDAVGVEPDALAWRKHAHLQLAMLSLLIASTLFGIARLALKELSFVAANPTARVCGASARRDVGP